MDSACVRSTASKTLFAYLENWPASDRGPRYFVAISALESAKIGSINPDEAKPLLIEFLAESGLMAEEKIAS